MWKDPLVCFKICVLQIGNVAAIKIILRTAGDTRPYSRRRFTFNSYKRPAPPNHLHTPSHRFSAHPLQISISSSLCHSITIINMPSGAKKRKAIKRKMETANHHHEPTSGIASNNSQGNGAGDHDDSSDHALTDEDVSPRASIHEVPLPEPEPEPEGSTGEDASLVPVEHRTVSPRASMHEVPEPEGSTGEDASLVPIEHRTVSPRVSMHEVPVPEPKPEPEGSTGEGASLVPVEDRTVSESEPPEPVVEPKASVATVESHTPLEIGEKSGERGSHSEGSEIPVYSTVTREAPATGPAPPLERRAVWWDCCGLLDLFGGSQR